MPTVKIAITLDRDVVSELDRLVASQKYPSRSRAVQEAVQEALARKRRSRLSEECAKLNPAEERAFAEEGMGSELEQWPEY